MSKKRGGASLLLYGHPSRGYHGVVADRREIVVALHTAAAAAAVGSAVKLITQPLLLFLLSCRLATHPAREHPAVPFKSNGHPYDIYYVCDSSNGTYMIACEHRTRKHPPLLAYRMSN